MHRVLTPAVVSLLQNLLMLLESHFELVSAALAVAVGAVVAEEGGARARRWCWAAHEVAILLEMVVLTVAVLVAAVAVPHSSMVNRHCCCLRSGVVVDVEVEDVVVVVTVAVGGDVVGAVQAEACPVRLARDEVV